MGVWPGWFLLFVYGPLSAHFQHPAALEVDPGHPPAHRAEEFVGDGPDLCRQFVLPAANSLQLGLTCGALGPKQIDDLLAKKNVRRGHQFFRRLQADGTLQRLHEQHFGKNSGISRINSHTFNLNMRNKLPQYRQLIQQVALEYQMEWQLLAAVAYQESHWDPEATSPTGVRGLMMLTLPTAKETGVTDRLDPLQSLRGGARYLKDLKRRLPPGIKEPDREWFALAAYNIGLGHLEDARVITQRQGGDPNRWEDVNARLPLLQQNSHYRTTRYGYARGAEAVTYVQNIRHYLNILNWQDISDNKPLPPIAVEDYLPRVLRGSKLSAL